LTGSFPADPDAMSPAEPENVPIAIDKSASKMIFDVCMA
jgi:hypothetical protein